MYDARGIANYFLERAAQCGAPITVMTLLKVLYFAHAWHLAKYGRPLVAQPFEAWEHGPVVRVVYEQLRGQGTKPVQRRLKSFDATVAEFLETSVSLDFDTQNFLDNIFDYYSKFHAYDLSDLTHEDGSPWDITWRLAEKKSAPGMIIPDSTIMAWFKSHGAQQLKM